MISRADIVAEARSCIGTPWRHQGRLKGRGLDCAGLLIHVVHALGLSDFDKTDYGLLPLGDQLRSLCDAHMTRTHDMRHGDVLLMRFDAEPQHIGILGNYEHGGLSLIHAYRQGRCVVEHRLDELWANRIVAAYAIPGIEG